MKRIRLILRVIAFVLALVLGSGTVLILREVNAAARQERTTKAHPNFDLEVVVNGRPLAEYYARGRTYVEALQGAEYELRLRNN